MCQCMLRLCWEVNAPFVVCFVMLTHVKGRQIFTGDFFTHNVTPGWCLIFSFDVTLYVCISKHLMMSSESCGRMEPIPLPLG